MKRAVICVADPENYIEQVSQHMSVMVINPATNRSRLKYLLDNSDYSMLITESGVELRDGGDYGVEQALWYTSGTTGDSKFRSFTRTQLDHVAVTICRSYNITENDRYLSVMPLWHAHGQGMYWAARHVGCEIKYISPADLKYAVNFSPTFVSAIPDVLHLMMRQQFPDLRFVRSASSALPDQLFYNLQTWSGVPVVEAFGMTEAGSHCFTNPLQGEQRVGTVGLPDGVEAQIVDSVLHIQGAGVFQSGWYNTGDLAEQDAAGYYRILGRVQDRITVRGYKLDPVSIENQLYSLLPNIGEVVVFGKDIVMCIYTGDVDNSLVRQTLISIGAMCNPKFLQRVEAIPKNTAGKTSRAMLQGLYQ
jgi:acyl-coenzyme A synthetase/AMP-(fatty) acid ligase